MESHVIIKAFGFLLLIIIGIPGNVFICLQFTYIRIIEKKLLPTNLILTVLCFFNFLVLFSRVIPQSLFALGVENLLNDTECKLVIYTYRVSRAMSICVTSLLSCHQSILIAPMKHTWIYLKQKVTQRAMVIIVAFWIINLGTYPFFILNANATKNITTSEFTLHLVYCEADFLNYRSYIINGMFYAMRDFVFVAAMILASSYMVGILLNHARIVRRTMNLDGLQRRLKHYKASRAIILLVALYVVLFGLDNSLWIYTLTLSDVSPDMNDVRIFLASSYAALSPILIISTNPKLQLSWLFSHKHKPYLISLEGNGHVNCIAEWTKSSG
ncbi:olfactory receptor class A-like protein 1 [Bufo gargarizans]|uniref:olfactory receptor class A-like protein 1 n=1 Tax=Bufo gargarizans TaxID=30331 RepID=UPI001CF3279F|nr:olfactory receptor class A-like protein 1 [Bufo gargarizans]